MAIIQFRLMKVDTKAMLKVTTFGPSFIKLKMDSDGQYIISRYNLDDDVDNITEF